MAPAPINRLRRRAIASTGAILLREPSVRIGPSMGNDRSVRDVPTAMTFLNGPAGRSMISLRHHRLTPAPIETTWV